MKTAFTVAVMLMASPMALAALSANLIGGGDFEDPSTTAFVGASGTVVDYKYWKREHSPRTQAEIEANTAPVRAWQFHRDYDLGRWMPVWGVRTDDSYDAQRGIGTFAQPRTYWSESGGWSEKVNYVNVSVDPENPGNHVMEGVAFRSWIGMFIQAPANQVPGLARFDFDYYLKYWIPPGVSDGPNGMQAVIYGVPESALPTWDMRWGPGTTTAVGFGPAGSTKLYSTPLWANWVYPNPHYTAYGAIDIRAPEFPAGQWQSLSDGVTAPIPGTQETRYTDGSFQIDEVFPYYYIEVWLCTYSESHEYFWMYGRRPTDVFTVAIDNVSLRVTTLLRGDVNLDGLVNALDISPFVARLTQGSYQAEADINGDHLVNALDISGFVTCLVNGGCAGQGGSLVPEPASMLSLVWLVWVASGRRRYDLQRPAAGGWLQFFSPPREVELSGSALAR